MGNVRRGRSLVVKAARAYQKGINIIESGLVNRIIDGQNTREKWSSLNALMLGRYGRRELVGSWKEG